MQHTRRDGLIAGLALALLVTPVLGQTLRLRPATTPIQTGGEGITLRSPEALACGEGTLLIADSGNARLLRFTGPPDALQPSTAWTVPQISYPLGVQVDPNGGVWVLDGKTRRIARLTSEGRFGAYLELGGGDAGPVIPRAFRIGPQGNLHVLDVNGGRIRVVSPQGVPQRTIAFPEGAGFFSDLAVDSAGTIYVVDSVGRRVYIAGKNDIALKVLVPDLSEELDFATGIATDERGHVYLADQNGGGIVVLGRDGSFQGRPAAHGWKPGMLRYPTDLCVHGNHLFVADRGNNRVQIFEILE